MKCIARSTTRKTMTRTTRTMIVDLLNLQQCSLQAHIQVKASHVYGKENVKSFPSLIFQKVAYAKSKALILMTNRHYRMSVKEERHIQKDMSLVKAMWSLGNIDYKFDDVGIPTATSSSGLNSFLSVIYNLMNFGVIYYRGKYCWGWGFGVGGLGIRSFGNLHTPNSRSAIGVWV